MRNQAELDRLRARLEGEYVPITPNEGGDIHTNATLRQADALEYIAFQLGQISRKLDSLIANGPREAS